MDKLIEEKPVTVWKRFDPKKKKWVHNHIVDGHVSGDVPTPHSDEQRNSWKGAYWWKQFALQDNTGVVTVLEDEGIRRSAEIARKRPFLYRMRTVTSGG